MAEPALLEHAPGGTAVLPPVPEVWDPPEERPPRRADGGPGGGGAEGGDDDGGGGGGGGGDPGKGGGEPSAGGDPTRAAELAFGLFVVAVAALFALFLLAYAVLLRRAGATVLAAQPPRDLGVATLMVVGASAALAVANGDRRKRGAQFRAGLTIAATLGALLLATLPRVWSDLSSTWAGLDGEPREVVLHTLLGLFAALVGAGLGFIARALFGARLGSKARGLGTTVRLCGLYWQFLTGLWLVLCGVLSIEG